MLKSFQGSMVGRDNHAKAVDGQVEKRHRRVYVSSQRKQISWKDDADQLRWRH